MIYNNKYIFGFHPVGAAETLKNLSYADEVTFGTHLRMGAGWGTNHMIGGLELLVPPALVSWEGRRLEVESNHQWLVI